MRSRKWENASSTTAYTYNSWCHMRDRCYNIDADNFEYYGGRGIKVCDKWVNDYDAFVEDMGLRPQGYTLERLDSDRDYTSENCIWASRKEQSRNRRNARILTYKTVSKPQWAWAEILGISWENLRNHIARHGNDKAIERLIKRMEF